MNSTSQAGSGLQGCLCVAGFKQDVGPVCSGCSSGQYSTGVGLQSCLDCALGTYSEGGWALACVACETGSYAGSVGQSACGSCASGSIAPTLGMSECYACGSGTFAGQQGLSACAECQIGGYSPGNGFTACSLCSPGAYNNWTAASSCRTCLPGQYGELVGASTCQLCPAGKYSGVAGLNASSRCSLCPRGYFSNREGQTSRRQCAKCPSGSTSDAGAAECFPCRPGEFPNELYGGCATCPTYSLTGINATSPEDCVCEPGYFIGYNAKALGGIEAYDGLFKTHTFQPGTDPEDGLLVVANALVQVLCNDVQIMPPTLLQPGFYPYSLENQGSCVFRYPVDVQYDASLTETYRQCIPCPRGSFWTAEGTCQLCPSMKYQSSEARTSCRDCPTAMQGEIGQPTCPPCPEGTAWLDGACRQCPDGMFSPKFMDEVICLPCPANMWSDTTTNGCKMCPDFSTGPGGTNLTGCKCSAGRFMQAVVSSPYCIQCGAGKYSGAGLVDSCLLCPNGTFSRAGAGVCTVCPARSVSRVGASACLLCKTGETLSADKGSCVPCPAGSYCGLDGSVVSCPLGTYSLKTGLTSASQCPLCPRNNACVSPLKIEPCPAHTYSFSGAVNKHKCICSRGYRCDYSFSTQGEVSLSLSRDQFEAARDAFIQAVARAAGVDPGSVQIVGMNR